MHTHPHTHIFICIYICKENLFLVRTYLIHLSWFSSYFSCAIGMKNSKTEHHQWQWIKSDCCCCKHFFLSIPIHSRIYRVIVRASVWVCLPSSMLLTFSPFAFNGMVSTSAIVSSLFICTACVHVCVCVCVCALFAPIMLAHRTHHHNPIPYIRLCLLPQVSIIRRLL